VTCIRTLVSRTGERQVARITELVETVCKGQQTQGGKNVSWPGSSTKVQSTGRKHTREDGVVRVGRGEDVG